MDRPAKNVWCAIHQHNYGETPYYFTTDPAVVILPDDEDLERNLADQLIIDFDPHDDECLEIMACDFLHEVPVITLYQAGEGDELLLWCCVHRQNRGLQKAYYFLTRGHMPEGRIANLQAKIIQQLGIDFDQDAGEFLDVYDPECLSDVPGVSLGEQVAA